MLNLKNRFQIHTDIFKGDKTIWAIFFFLCAISLIEVYSAASTLTYRSGSFLDPIKNHATFLFVGLIAVIVTHNIPCRWFKFYPFLAGLLSISGLLFLLAFGVVTNGSKRWIPLLGASFQPSELAKGAVVVGVAFILSFMQTERGADRHAFKYILWLTVPFCLMIMPENFSTAALLFTVVLMLMFIGRIPIIQIGKLLGILAIAAAGVIFIVVAIPKEHLENIPGLHRMSTWKGRFERYSGQKEKQLSPQDFDVDRDAQVAHANIAIAAGNLVGKFPGNSVERDFLSQAFSDFIFAIIIEETGLVGGAFVVLLYIVLLFRASRIANRCERNFPAFLVLGLALLLVTQALVNMAVAVGLIPVTGQPLPLISKGGSSTLINCIYIGMILSVSRFAKRREQVKQQVETNVNEEEFHKADGMA